MEQKILTQSPGNHFRKHLATFLQDLKAYGRKALDVFIRVLLTLAIAFAASTAAFYLCKIMWSFYIETPVGQRFTADFPEKTRMIVDVLSRMSIPLILQVTLIAFFMCLGISAVCQVCHVTRRFYQPRGLFGKVFVWGLLLTAAVAAYIRSVIGISNWGSAYAVALIPTMCIFSICFKASDDLLPEIGPLVHKTVSLLKDHFQYLKRLV
jgi:hypothetical protein